MFVSLFFVLVLECMWGLQAGTRMEQAAYIVGNQGFGLPRWNVQLAKGADPALQILPALESEVPCTSPRHWHSCGWASP